jgi:5-(carboxyamino)imidazole ribonucleotide synthase
MVGGGQLARMTQQAAVDLGLSLLVLAREANEPAAQAGARTLLGAPDDPAALARLAAASDVVTFDHELVPAPLANALAERGVPVRPRAEALLFAQDKLHARLGFAAAGLPGPAFRALGDAPLADLERFVAEAGWPVVIKARTGGYDGRGVAVAADREAAAAFVGRHAGRALLVEAHVDLLAEVALVGVRSPSGDWRAYPLVETRQEAGICRELVMPARVPPAVAAEAARLGRAIAETIDAVGIVAVELFLTRAGDLLVNEIALRPHNSGHATIEACATSQFHNHLRAVLDWPLGSTEMRAPAAALVNILGPEDGSEPRSRLAQALAVDRAAFHLYGKEARPGRKVGHVTALGADAEAALAVARRAAALLLG